MTTITSFENFIERNYPGLNFISISNQDYLPGQILNDDDRIIGGLSRLFPGQDDISWLLKSVTANIAGGVVTGSRNLDFNLSVLGLFALRAGAKNLYSIDFRFDKVTEIKFDTANGGIYENEVRRLFRELRHEDRRTWHPFLHQFVVMSAVIAEDISIVFKREGSVNGDVDIPTLEKEIIISGNYSWAADGSMKLSGNNIPFGVTGFTIKRQM